MPALMMPLAFTQPANICEKSIGIRMSRMLGIFMAMPWAPLRCVPWHRLTKPLVFCALVSDDAAGSRSRRRENQRHIR
jgi:hypothetical protein